MMRTRIKFCGITRREDAEAAVDLGVDAVGLVFAPESSRHVGIKQAVEIRATLPPFVACVALVRNSSAEATREIIRAVRPDYLQFHGDEAADYCESFAMPYIKAFGMSGTGLSFSVLETYRRASGILLDGHAPGELGGQGDTFNWDVAKNLDVHRLILAGGLTSENVSSAISKLHPYAVDVSSGIESDTSTRPKTKEFGKMRAFVESVKAADAQFQKTPDL